MLREEQRGGTDHMNRENVLAMEEELEAAVEVRVI